MDGLLPGDVREILRRAEAFGHGFGLIAIAVTIYFLDRQWASRVPRLLTHGLAAGLLADVIKMSVWRVRPRFAGLMEPSFTGTFLSASAKDWSNVLDSRYHSFPSAHTAVAVAAAITLGRFYPAGAAGFCAWRCCVRCNVSTAGLITRATSFGRRAGLCCRPSLLEFVSPGRAARALPSPAGSLRAGYG